MRAIAPIAATLAATLLLASCDSDVPEPIDRDSSAVASAAPEAVPGDDLVMAFARLRNLSLESDAQRDQVRQQVNDLHLLAREAEEQGLLERRAVRAELELQRLSWIANRMLAEHARQHPIDEAAVRAEYERGLSASGTSEYRVSHILVPDRARAEALIERLDDGEDFDQLAASLAGELGASNAGDLGWIESTQVPGSFAAALDTLKVGEYTAEPVQTEYGWHVIRLSDRRELAPPDYEEVEAGIRASLARRQAERFLERLRAEAGQAASE